MKTPCDPLIHAAPLHTSWKIKASQQKKGIFTKNHCLFFQSHCTSLLLSILICHSLIFFSFRTGALRTAGAVSCENGSWTPLENLESGVWRWVTRTDVASQICHFHAKPSEMEHGWRVRGWGVRRRKAEGGCKRGRRGEREGERSRNETSGK